MNRWRMFIPLCGFLLLAVILLLGFSFNDPHILPSALLKKSMPAFSLPGLKDSNRLVTNEDIKGRIVLVNVWATWCPTCKAEHAELLRLKKKYGLEIVGIVYKDKRDKALSWLEAYGDPYSVNIFDSDGRLGIDLGVYGAPESFLLDAESTILYKRVGDINSRIWRDELEPRLKTLKFFDPDSVVDPS
ncbi:MAG: DsbE family thiol:disulfide interchange protein [Pseudomonadales bacterium]|nr:DsbE family thiol:disulfide interchange protein [Pseudomonadales bacterium]